MADTTPIGDNRAIDFTGSNCKLRFDDVSTGVYQGTVRQIKNKVSVFARFQPDVIPASSVMLLSVWDQTPFAVFHFSSQVRLCPLELGLRRHIGVCNIDNSAERRHMV